MPILANNKVKRAQLASFLVNAGLEATTIQAFEQCYGIETTSDEDAKTKAAALKKIFSLAVSDAIPTINLVELLKKSIEKGESKSEQEAYRAVCLTMIKTAKLDPSMNDDGIIFFNLPASFSAVFKELQLDNIVVTEKGLEIDLENLLTHQTTDLGFLKLDADLSPMIILKSTALENKIFYQVKDIEGDDENVNVTPSFLVPRNLTPPKYSFMLDVSGSMQKSLPALKKSVIKMAEMIFEFEPKAQIQLSVFHSDVYSKGKFVKAEHQGLIDTIKAMEVEGTTALFKAAETELDKTDSQPFNNILLFTDGNNNLKDEFQHSLEAKINKLKEAGAEITCARNKFYIINYGSTQQSKLLHDLTKVFGSKLINSNDPELTKALSDKGEMQSWAALSEFFKAYLTVQGKEQEQVLTLDCSGQLFTLPTKTLAKQGSIVTKITNGNGDIVAENELQLAPPASVIATLEKAQMPTEPVAPTRTKARGTVSNLLGKLSALFASPELKTSQHDEKSENDKVTP
jgi:hypothetical protein